jgi:hypothetical protein
MKELVLLACLADRRLLARWTIVSATAAALISLTLLAPGQRRESRRAVAGGVLATLGGAVVGAAAAILYGTAGRLRFCAVILVLAAASLAYDASANGLSPGAPWLERVGLSAVVLLCVWQMAADGLYRLRGSLR